LCQEKCRKSENFAEVGQERNLKYSNTNQLLEKFSELYRISETNTENPRVGGSIPSIGIAKINELQTFPTKDQIL
jgi:hypothetical protein